MKSKQPNICAIVAVGPYNVIGYNGIMPWHSRSDLLHFRRTTYGYPCIFGKTTYENLPIKPLPGRLNIVCSSSYQNKLIMPDLYYAQNLESAFEWCAGYEKAFICGGAVLYKYAFDRDFIDTLYLTTIYDKGLAARVSQNPNSYTYFPLDLSVFRDKTKWRDSEIIYPSKSGADMARFFRYEKIK